MRFRPILSLWLGLAGWAVCVPARAEEAAAASGGETHRLRFSAGYRGADQVDYAISLAGFAGSLALVLGFQSHGAPRWDRQNGFDDAVQNALRASSRDGRRAYDFASNLSAYGGIAWVAFDAFGFALALDRNPRAARELFWMDTEAYAVSLLLANVTKRVAQRSRPYAERCRTDATYDPHCGTAEENVSFYSSHSATAGTSAGLLCAQHSYFRGYGGPGDAVACAGALGAMLATGWFRIASDNHWASDVAVGYAVGFASGYGLPWLLHFDPPQALASRTRGVSWRVLPVSNGSRLSLVALGSF